MNQYPLWKYLLILAVVLAGLFLALPNVFGEDPALQISANRGGKVDAALQTRVEAELAKAKIGVKRAEILEKELLFRLYDAEAQLKARDLIASSLGDDYVVALNLAPALPGWLKALGVKPMYLGLDLRGGVHFLMEVDTDGVLRQVEERFVSDLRSHLRDKKVRYEAVGREPGRGLSVRFRDPESLTSGLAVIKQEFGDLEVTEQNDTDRVLRLKLREKYLIENQRSALQQNINTLRNRVNELGVAEPVIQQQGLNRIVVQLPGVQDTARAKEILGATATLEFRMVDSEHDVQEAVAGKVPPASRLYKDKQGMPVLLSKRVMLTGEYITGASSGLEQTSGTPAVYVTLDGKGAMLFSRATREQVGKPMATVFIENKVDTKKEGDKVVKVKKTVEQVINIATIREELSRRFQISGIDSTEEARDLALLLRAGSLAAPLEIIEERTVGPSLGKDNIQKGVRAALVAFCLILVFMGVYYRVFGLCANVALAFNVVLVVAMLSLIQATLTLPGIAGIVLTMGIAVDANVLINERIREELRWGTTPQAAIKAGYEKAFSAILDSNVTTLIAGVLLFSFGSGPVKGFAVTLTLGIITSMFTAIMGTRALINLIYGSRRKLTELAI